VETASPSTWSPPDGSPDDVADAVAYLVSEGAGFVSGQRLVVNGGFHFA
jgi:NAD(P)-dependent dehydrogenase (short-subunit alcohol dehydrogenase family)